MAREGELAEPRLPAPAGVRTVLGFRRLSKAAYAIVRRAVDDDDAFRTRVCEAADRLGEASVGRAGWLWLHRPEGWETDPHLHGLVDAPPGEGDAGVRLRRERDGAEAAARRERQAARAAEAARRRVVDQLAESRRELGEAQRHGARMTERLEALERERNEAVRTQKRLEADLSAARRDVKVARAAAREAEAELLAERSARAAAAPTTQDTSGSRATGPRASAPAPGAGPPATGFDRAAARSAVGAASDAAGELARALADAAAALGSSEPAAPPEGPAPVTPSRPPGRDGAHRRSARGRRRGRAVPPLPPAVHEGSPEANRILVSSGHALLVVDGYNLARAAWSGLEPEEERRRTVSLLEEVRARSGAPVTVVFDGEDLTVAPAASRSIRVQFSASGETADDAIAALLGTLPPTQPVLVVSSDRAVADDARRQGAAVLGSRDFLTAAGR